MGLLHSIHNAIEAQQNLNNYQTSQQSSQSSAMDYTKQAALPLEPNYYFGYYTGGGKAAYEQAKQQALADYAEYQRNVASSREQREWEAYMDSTQVQRRMQDISAAGLNPWLALQGASFGGSVGQGSVASSSAGQVASGSGSGSTIAATAFGIAAVIKALAKIIA